MHANFDSTLKTTLFSSFKSAYGRIAYTDQQTGTIPVIFIHGLPTIKELFWPVLPHLNQNYRAITFDLNDYGESEKISRLTSKKIGSGDHA